MGESFNKLKSKCLTAAILKSVAVGLSLGIFVPGVLLLAFKLSAVVFHWALYIPIGLAVAVISGGLCFLFLRPTDKKIAIKYDAEFGLNEKLQTMVEFGDRGQEGDIITLQREDALERLGSAPAPKVRFANIWYFFLIAIIAAAVFLSGLILPRAAVKGTDVPPDGIDGDNPGGEDNTDVFEYTLVMQSLMDDLINAIRDSALEDDFRQFTCDRLTTLHRTMTVTTSNSEMITLVRGAVEDIDNNILAANSFLTLGTAVAETDAEISEAIKQGFLTYKDKLMFNMTLNYVNSLGNGIGSYIGSAMEAHVAESVAKLKVSQMPLDGSKNLKDTLNDYITGLSGIKLLQIDENDALYKCFMQLQSSLTQIRNMINGSTGDSILWERMENTFINDANGFEKSAVVALQVQSFKCIMETYVRQGLEGIFGVTIDLDELYSDLVYVPSEGEDPGDGSGEGPGDGTGGGGAGSGDYMYGSDDEIYDPVTGEKVKFGEILKRYEQAIIEGTAADDFPPELAKFLENYIYYLNNGTDKPNNN